MGRGLGSIFLAIATSYLFIIIIALALALVLPGQMKMVAPYATLLLQGIFFLSSLKLDVRDVWRDNKDVVLVVSANVFMLLLFPAGVYYAATWLLPSYALPLLLLAAMPTGMTTPFLVEMIGGKQSVALVLTVTSSLLAPFTVPLMISILAGASVSVSAWNMFFTLVKVIIAPFAVAQIVRYFFGQRLKPTFFTFKPISLVLLALLIAGVVAKQADAVILAWETSLASLLVLTACMLLFFAVGYRCAYWRSCEDRVTVALALTFMNFTLAIYLAEEFFSDPHVLSTVVLVIFPWALLLTPINAFVRKFICPLPIKV